MKTRQVMLAGILLLSPIGCRRGGDTQEKNETKSLSQGIAMKPATAMPAQDTAAHALEAPPIPILDSTTASIQFEREKNGYRFFIQPKDKHTRMESRCFGWFLDSLPASKVIMSDEENEHMCEAEAYKLEKNTADIIWVEMDSNAIAKSYGSEYVQVLSSAVNPVLLLGGLPSQGVGSALLFVEMPLGETVATLTFHSDDNCDDMLDINPGCGKRALPPLTVGDLHLKIKINVQEDGFEIREWP